MRNILRVNGVSIWKYEWVNVEKLELYPTRQPWLSGYKILAIVRCPTLSVEKQSETGADIAMNKVKKAVGDLQNGKSPGEDDLLVEFDNPCIRIPLSKQLEHLNAAQ